MSYTQRLKAARTISGLDRLGLYLANQGHKWTAEERTAYERRLRELRKRK